MDSCVARICSLLLPFLCECFSNLSLPFCFLSYLIIVYNNLEFILAMLHLSFQIFTKFSSKFNTEFIFECSMLMVYSCSSFPPNNYKSVVIEWLSCYCVEIACISSVYFCYIYWLHRPMVLCFFSTNFTNNL